MQQSVRDAFPGFTTPLEGRVAWMYLDVKGLITVGVGNLVDPVDLALNLPFVHEGDGSKATVSWPRFRVAAQQQDWETARAESTINYLGNPGVRPRNEADDLLFANAAAVARRDLDPAVLYWPDRPSEADSGTGPPVITAVQPIEGFPGDTVTITGSAFSAAFSVGFGDVGVISLDAINDEHILVIVPDGHGEVGVSVFTPQGSSDPNASARRFTYL